MQYLLYLLFLITLPAWAHNAWIEPNGQNYSVLYGHHTQEAYTPDKVKSVKVYDNKGAIVPHTLNNTEQRVEIKTQGKAALLTLEFDNGYWSKNPEGKWVNLPKKQVSGALTSSHNLKLGKTIVQWNPQSLQPLGQRLEIIPVTIPTETTTELTVQVWYEGQPLADKTVVSTVEEAGVKTQADGKVTLKLSKTGIQQFSVEHKIPLVDNENADTLSLEANLVFAR